MEQKNEVSSTPLPAEVANETKVNIKVDFDQARLALLSGKKIRKSDWNEDYAFMDGEFLCLQKKDGKHHWILRTVDLEGDDYIVL
jgi:hypothetical protein